MNDYEKFIYMSRYAKWRDDLKRRETWDETVTRFCNFFHQRHGVTFPYKRIWEAIHNLEVVPSMRAMMTAGPALERDNIAGYNPVVGSTRVVTKEYGNVPISSLEGEYATVLNKNGEWVQAKFTGYGKQKITRVDLRLNSSTEKSVFCTANHRWVLRNGEVLPTKELGIGYGIDFVVSKKPEIDADYALGIRHGVVYGDGTATKSCGRVKGYMVRLCGASAELLKYFDGYTVSYPKSAGGDPIVYLYDGFAATHQLKELPDPQESDSYLLGFIRGWLAADGSVTKASQVSLCVSGTGLEWLQNYSERLGFVIQRVYKQQAETNFGKRRQDSFVVYFSRSSCTKEDFLCSWKAERFKELRSEFSVERVEELNLEEEVFCAEVPETNTFVIEGGLVTGNCSYVAIDHPRAFDEIMYILMCGTGVGFSVEERYTRELPCVADEQHPTDTTIVVSDSRIGWSSALRELLSLLYSGKIPKWDVSKVRPAGARLKTFGGRASGPEPLNRLFEACVNLFKAACGRKLTTVECHDLVCSIADVVIVGGVRRSALISLSDLGDSRLRNAKSGQWWIDAPHRALANNSAVYDNKPEFQTFLNEWKELYESKSGERGIFNRESANRHILSGGRRDVQGWDFGTNPCGEIYLRSAGLCNLTEVIVRPGDNFESLRRKVELASILGTFQSTLTDFRYLRKQWKRNAEEERLLGVSLTGIYDNQLLRGEVPGSYEPSDFGNLLAPSNLGFALNKLKECVIETNKQWAAKLGINQSVATTCIKPERSLNSQAAQVESILHIANTIGGLFGWTLKILCASFLKLLEYGMNLKYFIQTLKEYSTSRRRHRTGR